jgi:Neprosin
MVTDQNQLSPELSAWLKARQSALKIVKTTTTPSGQTLDWVPIDSQVPGGKIATPPSAAMSGRPVHPHRRVQPARFELDESRVEHGPPGTVPILRPNITHFPRTLTLEQHLASTKKGGLFVNRGARLRAAPNDPNPAGYFHCTDGQSGTFYGWDGYLNVWAPAINNPRGNGADHSILQVWLQNKKPPLQSLEGGWTVDQSLNGDTQPHIFTYYTTNGYTKDGDNVGGYNTQHKGFVQYSSAGTTGSVVFPGIRINGISTLGGGQTDVSMKFQLYREPGTNTLNWWVAVQGIWTGYYPATLFDGGLGTSVTWVGSGGEVNSTLSNPELTKDQMGSGWQAAAGWTRAAFLRNLRTQSDMNGTMAENNGSGSTDAATLGGADPYTIQMDMKSSTTWDSYFYCGGPNPAAAQPQAGA